MMAGVLCDAVRAWREDEDWERAGVEKGRLVAEATRKARLVAEAAEKASTGKDSPATDWQVHHSPFSHLLSSTCSVLICFHDR